MTAPLSPPTTPFALRSRCRGWPLATVERAVLTVVGSRHDPGQVALATLVASWLVDEEAYEAPEGVPDDPDDAPPLNRWAVGVIWKELQRRVQ